jgi:hypothetical protein
LYAKQGGLIAYGFDNIDLFRRAAPYVARILNGEDAGALLIVNLKTAQALGCTADLRPMKIEHRSRILKAIARGRTWLQELLSGQIADTKSIAIRERCSERLIRMTLSLAFLSPEVVQAIIAGRLPRRIGMSGLADLPSSWNAQHAALGVLRARCKSRCPMHLRKTNLGGQSPALTHLPLS